MWVLIVQDNLKNLLDEINNWKLSVLSDFCLNECNDTCCNSSRILIPFSQDELLNVYGKDVDISKFYFDKGSKLFILNNGICPKFDLNTHKCLIFDDLSRPNVCGQFPIRINHDGHIVYFSNHCFIKDNKHIMFELNKMIKKYNYDLIVL